MYLSFYGLKIKPFQDNSNPSSFWLGEKQKEALAIFKYGISKMPGILLLTGDIGTGKTTLINVFLNSLLGDQFIVVKVPDPDLEEIDFMNFIADALHFKKKFSSKEAFFTHFSTFLDKTSTLGKKVLLVIDECQRLSSRLFEEIIQLSNIEKEDTKLLKVLLIGQNEFDDMLKKNTNKALHRLIAINYAIAPLDRNETSEFIRHRLKIAGATRDIFSPDAINRIYEFSAGIPRRINIICDHALLSGFGQERITVNGELIRECVMDLRPPDFLKTQKNDSPISIDDGDAKKIQNRPGSRQKVATHRAGKIFGTGALLSILIFIITFFTDPMSYRKVLHYIKNNGSETTVTEEHQIDLSSTKRSTDENVLPTGEQHKQDITADTPKKIIEKPNQTDDHPATNQTGIIKKEMTPENEVLPPDISSAEKKTENNNLIDTQNEAQANLTTGTETNPKKQNDAPDKVHKPNKPAKNQEVSDEPLEPVDPGAIIDWVLKKRPK